MAILHPVYMITVSMTSWVMARFKYFISEELHETYQGNKRRPDTSLHHRSVLFAIHSIPSYLINHLHHIPRAEKTSWKKCNESCNQFTHVCCFLVDINFHQLEKYPKFCTAVIVVQHYFLLAYLPA